MNNSRYTQQPLADYNHYGLFLKEKFNNRRIYKLSIDGGFTCPNRDGTKGFGGCTYCNVDSFTPPGVRKNPSIKEQVITQMENLKRLYNADGFIAYFQPNTNTYAPVEVLKAAYDEALYAMGSLGVGLSIGTRIDCLDPPKIALIESYTSRYYVTLEVGIESIYDETLKNVHRGHSLEDLQRGLPQIEGRAFDLCVHTIFGLPNETRAMQLDVAAFINRYDIRFIKLHQLHVVKGSVMGARYLREPFKLYSLEEYSEFLCDFIPLLKPSLIIQRLFATAYLGQVIAPNWSVSKSKIQGFLEKKLIHRNVSQGSSLTKHGKK